MCNGCTRDAVDTRYFIYVFAQLRRFASEQRQFAAGRWARACVRKRALSGRFFVEQSPHLKGISYAAVLAQEPASLVRAGRGPFSSEPDHFATGALYYHVVASLPAEIAVARRPVVFSAT